MRTAIPPAPKDTPRNTARVHLRFEDVTQEGRLVLEALPSPVSEMALVSMTCSLNVAEILGLLWKWINLSSESVIVSSEVLPPYSLAVRQNYYRGEFCSVKADGRRRNVPLSTAVVAALSKLKSRPSHNSPEDWCSPVLTVRPWTSGT